MRVPTGLAMVMALVYASITPAAVPELDVVRRPGAVSLDDRLVLPTERLRVHQPPPVSFP